ncbi:DUF6053 domain-containing protein [Lysobacter sp. CA199]|uniref:DUF6053 domain-containing protein n=1 Tax=Lysobacter sp. CA199 TaxID=3455608 RepID=UPI003F8D6D84
MHCTEQTTAHDEATKFLVGGPSGPTPLTQGQCGFDASGTNSVGPEGPPTKDFGASLRCRPHIYRDRIKPDRRARSLALRR